MCIYRYIYYSRCQHAELIRFEYCDTAKALGLPERDDLYRYPRSGVDKNTQAGHPGSSFYSYPPSSAKGSEQPAGSSLGTGSSLRQYPHIMSTATPSQAAQAFSWADAAVESDAESFGHADLIPRSVQSDLDIVGPSRHGYRGQRHYLAPHASSSLDTAGYDQLNIDIPLDAYSSLSMELTHQNGKVKEIVARFESFADHEGSGELLSDEPHVDAGNTRTRASSSSTIRQYDSDTETIKGFPTARGRDNSLAMQPSGHPLHSGHGLQSGPESTPTSDPRVLAGEHTRSSRQNAKSRATQDMSVTGQEEELDPQSPRKPIPSHWIPKTQGPNLKTAQRAKDRQSRKQASQGDSPIESGAKTIRGARSSVDLGKHHVAETPAFLTKDAAAAVESDITYQPLTRMSSTLRHPTSTTTLKSPAGSPVRDSPGRYSTIKITVSPTRPSASFGLDGSHQSVVTETDEYVRAPSTISSTGSTPYVSARQTQSVSQSTSPSVKSFVTAPESHDSLIPELDLTDTGGDKQVATSADGPRPLQSQHSRGKSEPHVKTSAAGGKATLVKPAVPKLSLKIPHLSPLSTDRKPPFTLGSASSSGSGTPGSPSRSSRIPRITAPGKPEQDRNSATSSYYSGTTLKRRDSAKTLVPSKTTKAKKTVVKDPPPSLKATATSGVGDHGTLTSMSVEPCDIPLPETPVTAPLRHVRTVNSSGTTPIISPGSPTTVDNAASLTTPRKGCLSKDNGTMSTTPTNESPAESSVAAHYLEKAAQIAEPENATLTDETVNVPSKQGPISTLTPFNTAAVADPSSKQGTADQTSEANPNKEKCIPDVRPKPQVSRVSSGATVKEISLDDDPIMMDSAIIYSRKKSDASGTSQSDPINEDSSSITSASTSVSRTVEVHYNTSPVRGRVQQYVPPPGMQAHSDCSPHSSASDLRATAPAFVPQQQTEPTANRPNILTESTQPQESGSSDMPFDPFELDILYGIPLYHHMYPVAIGSGTPFDCRGYHGRRYSRSPKKGRNNKFVPKAYTRGRKPKEYSDDLSPTKAQRLDDTKGTANVDESARKFKEDTTPHLAQATPARVQESDAGECPTDSESGSHDGTPFVVQMDSITRQAAVRNDRGAGRAPRQIDWSTIHNVPSHTQQAHFNTLQGRRNARAYGQHPNTYPAYSYNTPLPPSQHRSRQSNHRRYGGNGLYDNSASEYYGRMHHAAAGVPMDATAPFPDPLPPPGPRSRVQGGTPTDYIGYGVSDEKKGCGRIDIDPYNSTEWGGGLDCNKCSPDH